MKLREANLEDVAIFVRIFELASEGFSNYFWQQTAGPDGDEMAVARQSMAKKLTNAAPNSNMVAEIDGKVVGGVNSYKIGPEPEEIGADENPIVVPMIELENQAIQTRYINALAVLPEFQGRGIGKALLLELAKHAGKSGMSLIVFDHNEQARRLYQSEGYKAKSTRPCLPGGWKSECKNYILMTRAAN